jgi:hypothetical protein
LIVVYHLWRYKSTLENASGVDLNGIMGDLEFCSTALDAAKNGEWVAVLMDLTDARVIKLLQLTGLAGVQFDETQTAHMKDMAMYARWYLLNNVLDPSGTQRAQRQTLWNRIMGRPIQATAEPTEPDWKAASQMLMVKLGRNKALLATAQRMLMSGGKSAVRSRR